MSTGTIFLHILHKAPKYIQSVHNYQGINQTSRHSITEKGMLAIFPDKLLLSG